MDESKKFSIMSPHIYSKPMSPVSRDQEVKMYQLTSGAKDKAKSPAMYPQKRVKQRNGRGSYLNLSMSNQNKDAHKLMQFNHYKFV